MRALTLLFTFLFLTTTFAYESKYVCQEYNPEAKTLKNYTLILTKTGIARDKYEDGEYIGEEIPYHMEIYKGIEPFPIYESKGTVLTEDVYFGFTSDNQDVTMTIYLDEMEESSLTFQLKDGKKKNYDYICR